ncbi:MAG: glycosyltransferase family 4 protein [Chloroflexi bacterium]|nr:glycosyltransferase family 4 protein [Chloroflexota bacterium]
MVRLAIVLPAFQPNHLACFRSLASVPGIAPLFIELAPPAQDPAWRDAQAGLEAKLLSLAGGPLPANLVRQLVARLEAQDPDAIAIAGRDLAPMRAAARWAQRKGKPAILISDAIPPERSRWWRELPKKLHIRRHFAAAFVGGKTHAAYLARLGMANDRIWDRCCVVDNGPFAAACSLPADERLQLRASLALPEHYFLYAGPLSPDKNLQRLLEAYAVYCSRERVPWGLVLAGDGPQKNGLQDRAAKLRKGQVIVAEQPCERLPAYYALAGAFVLPSLAEPWGLQVNEAMAAGLPVIASNRCGCAADLVQDGRNGLLFDPREQEEMVASLGLMAALSDGQRQAMGRISQEIIAAYTPDAWAASLAACLQHVLAYRPQPVPSG